MLPPSSSSTLQLAPEALDPEFVAVILAGRFSSRDLLLFRALYHCHVWLRAGNAFEAKPQSAHDWCR
jgi:hypothetical protein